MEQVEHLLIQIERERGVPAEQTVQAASAVFTVRPREGGKLEPRPAQYA